MHVRNWSVVKDLLNGELPKVEEELIDYHIKLLDEICWIERNGEFDDEYELTWSGQDARCLLNIDGVDNAIKDFINYNGVSPTWRVLESMCLLCGTKNMPIR